MTMSQRDGMHDDLDDFIAESAATDPAFASAYERAGNRSGLLRAMVAFRKRTKRSQVAVAKAMGTTQSAVSELEGGASDPRFSTLDRYANAIGCRLHIELLTEAGDRLYVTPRPWRAVSQSSVLGVSHAGFTFNVEAFRKLVERMVAAPGPLSTLTYSTEEGQSVDVVIRPRTGSDTYALAA